MPLQYTIPLAISAVIGTVLFVVTLTQLDRKGALPMLGLFGAIAVWTGAYALQLSAASQDAKVLWNTVRYIGPTLVTLSFLVFAFYYTGFAHLATPRNVAVLAAIPVVTNVLVWLEFLGVGPELVRTGFDITTANGFEQLAVEYGPWFLLHAVYSFALSIVAIALFAVHWRGTEAGTAANKRTLTLLVGAIPPTVGSMANVAGATAIDWGPVGYVVTALGLVLAIFYY